MFGCGIEVQDLQYGRIIAPESLAGGGCGVFGIRWERAGEVIRDRTERVGAGPSEEGSPADQVVLNRVGKGEGGLIVQGGEFGAELAVESEQWTGFDRAKCFGKNIVAVWVRASAEVSFHRTEVELTAAALEIQLFCLGAVADKEVGDIVALACAGEVERIGKLGLGPTAGAKEFFDHAVETGVGGFVEQREIFAAAFSHANALTGFEPILKREELASLDDVQELSKVLRQGSVANGHLRQISNFVDAAVWHQMTEPLFVEIMACLHHIGGVLLQCRGFWPNCDQFGRSRELPGDCRYLVLKNCRLFPNQKILSFHDMRVV